MLHHMGCLLFEPGDYTFLTGGLCYKLAGVEFDRAGSSNRQGRSNCIAESVVSDVVGT